MPGPGGSTPHFCILHHTPPIVSGWTSHDIQGTVAPVESLVGPARYEPKSNFQLVAQPLRKQSKRRSETL
jgi:hypothetical protein